jgi:hypothetical protein
MSQQADILNSNADQALTNNNTGALHTRIYAKIFIHEPLLNAITPISEKTQYNALHLFSPTYLELYLTSFKSYLKGDYSADEVQIFESNFEEFLKLFNLTASWEDMSAASKESLLQHNNTIDYSEKYAQFESANPTTLRQQSRLFDKLQILFHAALLCSCAILVKEGKEEVVDSDDDVDDEEISLLQKLLSINHLAPLKAAPQPIAPSVPKLDTANAGSSSRSSNADHDISLTSHQRKEDADLAKTRINRISKLLLNSTVTETLEWIQGAEDFQEFTVRKDVYANDYDRCDALIGTLDSALIKAFKTHRRIVSNVPYTIPALVTWLTGYIEMDHD